MDAIKRILVPTDLSAHADEAFRVAHTLARAIEAEVVLFHIAHTPAVVSEGGQLLTDPGTGKTANLWDRFQSILPNDSRVRIEHQVIIADRPGAKHILEILARLGCDLIVMGTHGRSWLKHLLFGSVTEEVVRLAHCPVMVVKAPAHQAAPSLVHAPSSPGSTKAEDGHAG
jgi:nucleotide-binding universal stress UspA family protein